MQSEYEGKISEKIEEAKNERVPTDDYFKMCFALVRKS